MATTIIRTLILYSLVIIGLRLMGKRQIGEMQPAELVTAILISDLCAVPMQDLGIPLLQGAVPIILLFAVELLLSSISASSVRARTVISGKTSVLIRNGTINQAELRRLRLNVAELLEELRLKDVFDPRTVGCACLETNGKLSVQLMAGERPATAAMMGVDTSAQPELYTTVIVQGRVLSVNLRSCGRDRSWLNAQLRANKLTSPGDVYLMVLDNLGGIILVPNASDNNTQGSKEG